MQRRLLYCIPIVHTEADLGSLAPGVRRQLGGAEAEWKRKQAAIAEFWKGVRAWCDRLPSKLEGFRLYQDGLPVCGSEASIVAELAAGASPNHVLLQDLVRRGAALEGTESPGLLLEEYELAKASLAGAPTDPARARRILTQRDEFIATRIETTLKRGETGLLFVGMLHDVLSKIPQSIDIQKVVRPR